MVNKFILKIKNLWKWYNLTEASWFMYSINLLFLYLLFVQNPEIESDVTSERKVYDFRESELKSVKPEKWKKWRICEGLKLLVKQAELFQNP